MKRSTCLKSAAFAMSASIFLTTGCTSPTPDNAADRSNLASEVSTATTIFSNEDPSLQELLNRAVGYAVFPDVGKGGFVAGGSYGQGEVYSGGQKIGYADITQATFGLQAGVQNFSELVVFMREDDLKKFREGKFSLQGNVSAVAIKPGAARSADVTQGVLVFVRTKGGLMAEASLGGQRFRFTPIHPAPTTAP